MEPTLRPTRRHVYLLWLAGGALVAAVVLARQRTSQADSASVGVAHAAQGSENLKHQLERLERQVLQLKNDNDRQTATLLAVAAASTNTAVAVKPPARSEETPEVTEEHLHEQVEQKIEMRYALLERRFVDEPLDNSGSATEEQIVRSRIASLQGYELLKLDCRYTMCRLEVKSDVASAAGMLSRLGFKEGGEVRRRQDGTFLVFAGREGFPFQEVNRVD